MKQQLATEEPLFFLDSLAMKIGLREAVILQEIHFSLAESLHVIEGRRWIYNTYKDWKKHFPFWSEMSIKRTILNLEKQGILLSANWNALKLDKTKWYSINYEKVAQLELPLLDQAKY